LQNAGVELELRDIAKDELTVEELDQLIGRRDYKLFLNSRNELYRRRNMKANPPSRAEALKLMAKEPNLIRRPIVIRGSQIILGCDEEALRKIAK
jgi:arsenate reductase-like glutaredoxin family protein